MAADVPKTDDPYGGFNEFDHAYDLGVSYLLGATKNVRKF
jgi:hypothetical protein